MTIPFLVSPPPHILSTQGMGENLKLCERVPNDDIWLVYELISWALRKRAWCVYLTLLLVWGPESRRWLCDWEWPSLAFPSHLTSLELYHIVFRTSVPKTKTQRKFDNFLPLVDTLYSRETSFPLFRSPSPPFSLLAAHRGHSRSTLCACCLLCLLHGDGCSGAVAKLGRWFFSIRKELVCTRFTQELDGRGTGREGRFFIFKNR